MSGLAKIASSIAFAVAFISGSWAQALPVADGSIRSGEYAVDQTQNGIRAAFSLSADGKTLYAAVEAATTGWVSLGLGTRKMDGSHMVFGYVKDGVAAFSEERGKGWSHSPTAPLVLAKAASESSGRTVLEFSIPAESFVKGKSLNLIGAIGARDDFVTKHTGRLSIAITFP